MTPDYDRANRVALRPPRAILDAKRFASAGRDPADHHARAVTALAEIAAEYGYMLTPLMPPQPHVKGPDA